MITDRNDSGRLDHSILLSRAPSSLKTKGGLANFRASGPKEDGIRLTPPKRMTLEQAIAYIQDDELVEVTPRVIRIRKRYLDPHERGPPASREGGGELTGGAAAPEG